MQTHGFTSSGPGPSLPGRNDKPHDADWKRASTFHIDGLSCRHCANHVSNALCSLPGVLSASVSFSTETAKVCHDARLTHEREIVASMAQRGFWLSPALGAAGAKPSWFDAPRLGIVLALVGNLIALALWTPARTAPRLPWVELAFAVLLMLIAAPPLAARAYAHAKQGIWGAEIMALVAACCSVALGVWCMLFEGEAIPLTPNFLFRLGTRPDGAAVLAFEGAGAILGFAFLGHHVHQSAMRKAFADVDRAVRSRYARVRRVIPRGDAFVPCAVLFPGDRVRLMAGEVALADLRLDVAARVAASTGCLEERAPGQMLFRGERLVSAAATGRIEQLPRMDASAAADAAVVQTTSLIEHNALRREGDRVESMTAFALAIASVWFAVFAIIMHALLARRSPHPGVFLAGVTVLVGASSAAFTFGLPLARTVAVLRARTAGVVVNDVSALEALGAINFAYFDLSGDVRLHALHAFRALWHRAIACRIVSGDDGQTVVALGHRFGVPATGDLGPEDKSRIVGTTREAGGQVLYVGHDTPTARMIPADVFIAVAPTGSAADLTAPIVLREPNLQLVVWLVDLARSLRSRTHILLASTLVYDAIIIPLCVAGLLAPIVAAALSFGLTMATNFIASRVCLPKR